MVYEDETHDICFVRWHDNKIVHLISNFARPASVATIERLDSKQKKRLKSRALILSNNTISQ